jgi:ribonucleoside-diphosphate reductase alpha chain
VWLVEAAARRQKWIDQAQSLNIYMAGASGKKLDDTYKLAWLRGLKTTYYLRTTSRHAGRKIHRPHWPAQRGVGGAVRCRPSRHEARWPQLRAAAAEGPATDIKFCAIDDPGCEACQ